MKSFAAFLTLLLAVSARAETVNYLTNFPSVVGRYRTLLAQDCGTVFYLPRVYAVSKNESSVTLVKQAKVVGAGQKIIPTLKMQLVLTPEGDSPSASEIKEMADWGKRARPACAAAEPRVLRYPSVFLRMKIAENLSGSAFSVVKSVFDEQGKLTMNLEADPTRVNASKLIRELNYFDPEATVEVFVMVTEASVVLDLSYEATALFSQRHYTEQVCTSGERCFRVFGMKIKCKRFNHCTDLPRMTQQLDDVLQKQRARMTVYLGKGVPEQRVFEAQAAIMSRFMLSRYREVSRTNLDGIATITLGELRKEVKDAYSDEEVVERMEQSQVAETLSIRGAGDALADGINKAFSGLTQPRKR